MQSMTGIGPIHPSACSISKRNGHVNDDKAGQNEHGWASVVNQLCDKHNVNIQGVDGIGNIIKEWRNKVKSLNAKRDEARIT